ncbi:YcaO-like family protein [Nonomuraea soli]|uniref:Ribosomal protein S12 methylthiotransferase accessory factor n=1 Tax=Nonomuraea soli TaxID=1032476 RepID=A0A7W0HMM8_9ACTN|nr:YcaO-like family protein [Nonomuraea soli]MBA2888939.1 ribosomal protein S12 methylthiotransferase accessory factor [Nonomuraea soli]
MGIGRLLDDDALARRIAIAEAAERYAGLRPHPATITATADEVATFDLSRVPLCSPEEYGRRDCPLEPPDPSVPIRWVAGTDLHSGSPAWIPAVMACYGLRPGPGERFACQISTGHAVHTDREAALLAGVLEVVERDAIALAWQLRLPLPPLEESAYTRDVRYLLDRSARRFLTTHLFDATTDLGVPTVCVLQAAPHDPAIVHLLGGSVGSTPGQAAEKALIEMITFRFSCYTGAREHAAGSALAMARPERGAAFSFLTEDLTERGPSGLARPLAADGLRDVLGRLARLGMRAYAVDRTTSELRDAGLHAVAVIVPELQPVSPWPHAQFRAHSRLREAPARMGFAARTREEVNPWPQPFA